MTIKVTITEEGKTITELYGDDRPDPIVKTRMQEIEQQTGIQLDRTVIIDRSQQSKNQQQESTHGTNP